MTLILATYLHTIDPYAIMLWEGGPIRWYGLSYLVGFMIAFALIKRITLVGNTTLKPHHVGDFVATIAIGGVVGGRLGYILLYKPALLVSFTSNPPFWGLLAINEGGMASHGGMIGGLLATLYYARRRLPDKTAHATTPPTHSWPHLLDLFAFAAPLGLFFGRIANFINGELIGRPCSPSSPWAVKFPQEMYRWDNHQIIKLQPIAHLLSPSNLLPYDLYSLIPTIIDQTQRGNRVVIDMVEPLLIPRHPSQIYEALLEGILLFIILAIVWAKPRKPLIIGSLFLIFYGAFRIFAEFFREPDAHIADMEYATLNITRGQWLSALLLIAGILLLTIFSRRTSSPMGGWKTSPTTPTPP